MMAVPTKTWMKLTHRLGRDANPLRRRSDVIDGLLLPAAMAAFLVLCPLVVAVTGAWVHADTAAARQAELSWHSVTAVLLQAVPGPVASDNGANTWQAWTLATWTVHGKLHVGDIPAAAKSAAGRRVTVWLDRAGNVRTPLTVAQTSYRAIEAMMSALAVLAVLMAVLAWLARRVLDRRRLAGWETEWLAIGPRWSRQA